MPVDAFLTVESPLLPVKALTSSGYPNTINLAFEVGNSSSTPTTATLQVTSAAPPATITDITEVLPAISDSNPNNNKIISEITLQ